MGHRQEEDHLKEEDKDRRQEEDRQKDHLEVEEEVHPQDWVEQHLLWIQEDRLWPLVRTSLHCRSNHHYLGRSRLNSQDGQQK